MTSSISKPEDLGILWLAICSNAARTPEQCLAETEKLAAMANDPQRFYAIIGDYIPGAYINRMEDQAFIEALFVLDSAPVGRGCTLALVETVLRSDGRGKNPDVETYFSDYTRRYGEDVAFLTYKLRLLTLYTHYPQQQAETERILAILQPAADTTGGAEAGV